MISAPIPASTHAGGDFFASSAPNTLIWCLSKLEGGLVSRKVFEDHAQDLGVDGFRVLTNLLRKLDYQNHIAVSQADMAREMNIDRARVNRAIKRLIGLGALIEGPKWGQNRTYTLNPAFGWKGKGSSHQKAVRTAEKAKAAGLSVVKGGQHQEAGGQTA